MLFSDLLIIYLYSYFPAILLGAFFWWMDRFERESIFLVSGVFLWGAFGAGLLSVFWNTFFHVVLNVFQQGDPSVNDMLVSVLVAPFIEEFTKGIVILILLKLSQVDNITDGILLGVIIGLGFAASENVHYATTVVYPYSGELAMWYNLWFREIHTTLLHASATAVWGAMIGYSRQSRGFKSWIIVCNGFLLAMLTHGFWNFLASFVGFITSETNVIRIAMRFELFFIFGALMTLFLVSVRKQSRIIIEELSEENDLGVIPQEHIGFFASMIRVPRRYKLPKKISAKDYAKIGVKLAFRKHDYRFNPSQKLKLEIDLLRNHLKAASEYVPDSLSLHYGS